MKMRFAALTVACSLALIPSLAAQAGGGARGQAAAPSGAKAKVLASVQGAWTMTSSNGQDMTGGGPSIVVTITDDKYVQTVDGNVVEKGTFKFDETKKPMTIDITITEGENAGKVQLGVWELAGNKMTGKLGEPGTATRPANFTQEEGYFTFVMVKK